MKVLRPKSIFTLLYGLAMMIPCFAIGTTCLYVQFNKNAYQSYSGNEITENTFIETYDDFILNETYYFNNGIASQTQYDYGGNGYNIYVDKLTNYKTQTDVLNVNFVSLYIATNGTISLTARDISGNFLLNISNSDMNNYNFVYNGISQSLHTNFSTFFDLDIVYKIQRISPLDNVFYYAVDKFTKDNNFGEIDFFYYFRGMFLSDTSANNQWFNFINWYMNYAMLVSCAYILFLAMMWFINFARKLLEKGFNAYDW